MLIIDKKWQSHSIAKPGGDKRGSRADDLTLTPLELIDRIAALVPPPRTHWHRYFGVLAPTGQGAPDAVLAGQSAPNRACVA